MLEADGKVAVVLLSGGLDSATVLAIARSSGYACHCLSFDYGQRHRAELAAAAAVASSLGAASHRTAVIDLRAFGGSALTSELAVPKDREAEEMSGGIPVTYVPARNTIFLSYALGLAEVSGAEAVFVGVNAVDYSGYPDCRPAYLRAFEAMAQLATRSGVEGRGVSIEAPLLACPKVEIIRRGRSLGVDYGLTHSCYDPVADARFSTGYGPCRRCDACLLRQRAFAELGEEDPLLRGGSSGGGGGGVGGGGCG